ncbi:lytic transglycosylase domain-containing protein [Actinacidiphila glaucinigra]|uniref:aggregation-promoting factor C-terminal-like domain-containing protein n=1 Tax=Actinacidiphila glaucinigra TaxID=235986 RepID=UPI002DD8320A|nr:transglycosylase SLT domain-containing protein [Actinacidiphila glaucinigra]WSD63717.1 lytic transglycosylase domain-containing protein [Actinacidiphila glaucinigra]
MSRISVRGIAVASATAVTSVGAVVGVATSSQASVQPVAATDTGTVLADIPAGQQVQQASLTQQVKAQSDAADTGTRKAAEQAARKQAGRDATARKAAEAKAEADRKAEAAARAALVVKASYTVAEVQAMAQALIGDASQYQCFSNIVTHESGWNYTATNSSSGAYGLVQALPGSKMASAGADWRTNPGTQIKWGLKYMDSRYGSPCGAWSFWQANNWY